MAGRKGGKATAHAAADQAPADRESTQPATSAAPKPSDRLARGLLKILDVKIPTVRKGLKMKRTLEDIGEHLMQMKNLAILNKAAYKTEVLALADPTAAEDLNDVSYCAALVVLEILGCNDFADRALKNFKVGEEKEIVTQVQVGILYVCEQIGKMLQFERDKGEDQAEEVAAQEAEREHINRKTGQTRPCFVPVTSLKATIENLEGDLLVLPEAKWRTSSARKATSASKIKQEDEDEVSREGNEGGGGQVVDDGKDEVDKGGQEQNPNPAAPPATGRKKFILHGPRAP